MVKSSSVGEYIDRTKQRRIEGIWIIQIDSRWQFFKTVGEPLSSSVPTYSRLRGIVKAFGTGDNHIKRVWFPFRGVFLPLRKEIIWRKQGLCFSRFSSHSCTPRAPTTIREFIAVRILHGSAQENIHKERKRSVTGSKMSVSPWLCPGPPFRPSYTITKHRNRQRRLSEYYCPIEGPPLPAKLIAKAQQTAGLSLKMVPGQLRVYNSLNDLQTTHARFP